MIPPTTDPADKRKADALDRWVERQKEEAMRNLPTDLEMLPSPLLLEQMEREAAQRQRVREGCSVPPPQLRCSPPASIPAAKPSSSFHRRNRLRAGVNSSTVCQARYSKQARTFVTAKFSRLAVAPPMPSSARCSDATPEELEERLRFFARQIKSFRRTCLMYSSPELMERIWQMERDYETAVRQFYCRPPSTPGLQGAAAAEQPTPGLQGAAAAEQPTPGLQGAAAAEQPTPGLQGAAAAEQPTPGLQGAAAAEQPTPGLQGAAAAELPEGPEGGLPPLPGPEHLLSFLWGVLMELKPDHP
ncbi:hypothetical protein CRENBAI_025516 [Crenichthys baileyi]|uniref:Uncharacterized protein n=1 Tax=Crenichthys baileyi TaxID=28760 RepID=A0AAV9RW33_9TELE